MTGPTLRPSPQVPYEAPTSTVSFPQSPLLIQPVCPHMLEQYCSVRLAQGVGGRHWVSPGLLTMLWQKRQRGEGGHRGRVESQIQQEEFSLWLHPTPFPWPVAPNKHPIYLANTKPQWVGPLSHSGRHSYLTMNVVFVLTETIGWKILCRQRLSSPFWSIIILFTPYLDQQNDAGTTFIWPTNWMVQCESFDVA